jgi:hypothetical protein
MAKSSTKKSEPKSDADAVRASAANPGASLVGSEHVHRIDGCPLSVTVLDGARARLELEDHDPLSQAEIATAVKLLEAAIQETY